MKPIIKKIVNSLIIPLAFVGPSWADAPDASGQVKAQSVKAKTTGKEWDSLKVNPSVAVKDTPAKEINLPGVLKIQGESTSALDFTRARKIQLTNGGIQAIYVSANEPNRIQLPFVNPHVVAKSTIDVDKRKTSNNVYISFNTNSKEPVPVFIERPEGNGPVLALQLIPKGIPSQTYIVEDVSPPLTQEQQRDVLSSQYIMRTQTTMEVVGQGAVPPGYSVVDLKTPPLGMNGLLVEVDKKLSSREADIYIYKVTNPTRAAVVLQESEFDGDLVQAISIMPKPSLAPKESATVIVLTQKEKKGE